MKSRPRGGRGFLCSASIAAVVVQAVVLLVPQAARAQDGNAKSSCKIVVVGYMGGLETPNHKSSGVTQVRERLIGLKHPGVCVHVFSAYVWWKGIDFVRRNFPEEHAGRLTSQEISQGPKVIIYGHSFGGWAALSLARKLSELGVPVELTVQMDSVGFTDQTVPSNVKSAANFCRRARFIPFSRGHIRAQDSGATKIVADSQIRGVGHVALTRAPQISDLIVSKTDELYRAGSSPAIAKAGVLGELAVPK